MTVWLLLVLLLAVMALVATAAAAFGSEAGPPFRPRHRRDQDQRKP